MNNSTKLPESISQEISATGGNLSKVARSMGLDYHALKARASQDTWVKKLAASAEEPEDFRDLARPDLRRYAIAAKRLGAVWPAKHQEAIKQARLAYDAGTHEMCQGHNQGWVIQYLIPRLVRAKPRPYFATMEVWG